MGERRRTARPIICHPHHGRRAQYDARSESLHRLRQRASRTEVPGDSHRMWNSGLLTRRDGPYVQGGGSTRERISTHQLLEGADEQQRK